MAGNDQFTKILLHCNGTNGSTSFPDECAGALPHTFTAAGNAQVSTSTFKFATGALSCDGTGDWISTPDSADFTFGSSDFTVDFWFNNSIVGGVAQGSAWGQNDNTGAAGLSTFGFLQNVNNRWRVGVSPDGSAVTTIDSTTAFTSTGWHHLAFVRTGNILKLFLDGVQEGADTAFASAVNNSANNFRIGALGEVIINTWNGFIDEFRVSIGVARWTANFTPPAVQYDDGLYLIQTPYIPLMAQ